MTRPTFLQAIARPYSLSQRHLLREREFESEAERRGVAVSHGALERLARDRLLLPTLRVSKPVRRLRTEARGLPDWQRRQILSAWPSTTAPGLLDPGAGFVVEEPSTKPHTAWKRRERTDDGVSLLAWDFLYSPYRLLLLPGIQRFRMDLEAARGSRLLTQFRASAVARAVDAAQRSDEEVALLTALEPSYYPSIVGITSMPSDYGDFDEFQTWDSSMNPAELYTWLDWNHADLLKLAERYLHAAYSIDPNRRWIDLVRLMDADHWDKLEGAARLAIDFRIASEIILRFLEDLARGGLVPALPDVPERAPHVLQGRLKPDRSELDETLLDYGLSPHPALLLVLEGSCEEAVLPRVLRHYGIPINDDFVKILLLGGLKKKPELLARYLAPSLRRLDDRHAVFLRPPARVLVAADAEEGYRTESDREARRADWVRPAFDSLDQSLRTAAAEADLKSLATVTTWSQEPGRGNFEYAHFSDRQLARAILATSKAPVGVTLSSVQTQVAILRRSGANLKRVWKDWPDPQPSKLGMWEHLWPELERRIKRADRTGSAERIPVVRVAFEAWRIATLPRHVVLRLAAEN